MYALNIPRTAQILFGAIKILEEEGWIKGKLHTSRGHCAIGAMVESSHKLRFNQGDNIDAHNALRSHLDCNQIAIWNDRWFRTKSSVINAMRMTAEKEIKSAMLKNK
jgi:hypothetical protein